MSERDERPRVVIADPDPIARRVVRDALEAESFVVVAEAADGVEAAELTLHYAPELLLLEAVLPRMDGLSVVREVISRGGSTAIVLFAAAADDEIALRALRAGAKGFLSKGVGAAPLPRALHAVLKGEAAVSRKLTMRLVERLRRIPGPGAGVRPVRSDLTAREWEVLDLLSAGASTSAIAERLSLAEDTVHSHVKRLMRKLGVHSRAEAVKAADRLLRMTTTG